MIIVQVFGEPVALGIVAEILFCLEKIEAESPPILFQELERPNNINNLL